MNTLYSILVSIDVLLAIGIIGLILIQHGKGADVGAAFGSGASGTVFGSQGSASFLTRLTAILATLFFINSLALAYLASNRPVAESVIDNVEQTEINTTVTDIPDVESMKESESSDLPDQEMGVEDDMPVDTQTDAISNDSLNEVQDSMDAIKEEVESTLDNVTPDDVPE
ncbi:MAG: preprotein translocase subunit SecG [Gammaproteobacteria bacterium]|nr:MAG: preprotein translocase subunit SecG [Gammaproteobacteria bacterium]